MRTVRTADRAQKSLSSDPLGSIRPTHEEIAQRAYQLFLERGADHGDDQRDWFTAEDQLIEERRSHLAIA